MTASKNYLTYLSFTAVNLAVSAALLAFLANSLSKADYALYGVISSVAGVALIFLNFGHKEALFKATSQADSSALRLLSSSLRPWMLGAFGLVLLAGVFQPQWLLPALAFWALYVLIILAAIFRGRGSYARDAAAWPIYRLLWLVLAFAAMRVLGDLSLFWVFFSSLCAALLALLCLGGEGVLKGLWRQAGSVRLPFQNPTLVGFFALELATVAYLKIDVLMLHWLKTPDSQVAEYFFAIQLFEAAMLALAPLGYLFFNRINQAGGESVIANVLRYGLAIALVWGSILLIWQGLGRALLAWFFPEYLASFELSSWLFLALLPMGLNLLLSHLLFAQHKERVYAIICFAALALCICLNFWLIPVYGVTAAAWARLATEVFILVCLLCYLGGSRRARAAQIR